MKEKQRFTEVLREFNCKTFSDLNKNAAFKITLLNICNYRSEKYKFWKPREYGFILITDKSYLEFEFCKGEYKCTLVSIIYS